MWLKGHFAIEYKGKHKGLSVAYWQLLRYHDALENPPLLVVTDPERYEVHTKFDRTVRRVDSFTNRTSPEPENLSAMCPRKQSARSSMSLLEVRSSRLQDFHILRGHCAV